MRGYRNFTLGLIFFALCAWFYYIDSANAAGSIGAAALGVGGIVVGRGANKAWSKASE